MNVGYGPAFYTRRSSVNVGAGEDIFARITAKIMYNKEAQLLLGDRATRKHAKDS